VSIEYTATDHEFRESDAYAQAKYTITLRWLRDRPTEALLYNIGCGAGLFNRMAVQAGFRVEAFEPDRAAYDLARKDCPARDCVVHPFGLDGVEGERVADIVVMHDVLEHIADDQAAVVRLRRLIVDDGRLVLSVPAMPSLFGYHDEQLGHYRRYTRHALQAVLAPAFVIERLRYFGFTLVPVTGYYSRIRRRPYPTGSAESGVLSRGFRGLCSLEARVPTPLGTSLVCLARPRERVDGPA
jgi:2-polyprenyl-3-methyl-5-hydroxy-6-metoxy-1,4-benzoquinol methylase